jgi:chromate transporter
MIGMDDKSGAHHHLTHEGKAVSRWDLFSGFLFVGMFGFGGIATAIFHVVVERKRWLTVEEYASTLGLGQVLPGANLINLTTMVGDRFQGALGALIALSGLMLVPILCLLTLATVYDRFSDLPDVHSGMLAAAAGAVGLTIGTGIKLARTILKSIVAIVFAAASFLLIGWLHFPILETMLVLAPLAVAAGFWSERR